MLKRFSFLVLCYNHEDFIIEHLESIKFLVDTHGRGWECQLIVSDDASRDRSPTLVESWVGLNRNLFSSVHLLLGAQNVGTCAAVCRMLEIADGHYVKITAGDDVYSYSNIFDFALKNDEYDIASGFPLELHGSKISENPRTAFNLFAAENVYRRAPLRSRLTGLSIVNAPNLIYRAAHLKNADLQRFVKQYDVVEDWPILIAISTLKPSAQFRLSSEVLVYYRRSLGSTYLVASNRFQRDRRNIFDYLIQSASNRLEGWLLRNRRFCDHLARPWNRLLNISFYLFVFRVSTVLVPTVRSFYRREMALDEHVHHYDTIRSRAALFRSNIVG
jgi:glycosyltransferase involved in cell wall biosynthesis